MDPHRESFRYPISDSNLVGRDSLVHCGGDSGVDARTKGIAIGCAVGLSGPEVAKTFYQISDSDLSTPRLGSIGVGDMIVVGLTSRG